MSKLKSYTCGKCLNIQPMINCTGEIAMYCIPGVGGTLKQKWVGDTLVCLSQTFEDRFTRQ